MSTAQPEPVVPPARPHGSVVPSLDIQELWYTALRWEWSSLVLVPAHPGGSAVWIAKALAEVGASHRGRALKITPQGTTIESTSELIEDLTAQSTIRPMKTGTERWNLGQSIIAIDSVVTDPAGIAVALAADAVLLCLELGKSDIASAQRTVQLIGREHFIGCVIVK